MNQSSPLPKRCTCQPNKIDPHCDIHGIPKHTPILDMFKMSEDERIDFIVNCIRTAPPESPAVTIMVDDEPNDAKILRYMAKVKAKLPTVIFSEIIRGPVPGGVMCKAKIADGTSN